MSAPTPGPPPNDRPGLAAELDELAATAAYLESLVEQAHERLGPILRDPTPGPGEPGVAPPAAPPATAVAGRVRSIAGVLTANARQLGELLGRVDL